MYSATEEISNSFPGYEHYKMRVGGLYEVISHDHSMCDASCPGYVRHEPLIYLGCEDAGIYGIVLKFIEYEGDEPDYDDFPFTHSFYLQDCDMEIITLIP